MPLYESPLGAPLPLHHVHYTNNILSMSQNGTFTDTRPAGLLILDFLARRTVRNQVLPFMSQPYKVGLYSR